ncbi:ABC transporter substrate-binding protein [Jeotgalibacillus malaysiensis]|uniref:ABC transporter substrate-binding protein n=1 Tax=Jeotgalibacillus malaysiensis TaxID=1508404 RepID=UPI00384F2C8E
MKKSAFVLSAAAAAVLAACGGNAGSSDGDVTLEFFQYKQEAVGTFDELIAKFEEENPGITVEQNNVPESDTVLLSRLTQNDIPDVMSVNGGVMYGELVRAGVLTEVTDHKVLDGINDEYSDMIARIAGDEVEGHYGFPHTVNANGVIYNKTMFEDLGLETPQTWDEFIELAEEIESAGETPFYSTYGEAWTILPPLNSLASNIQPEDFYEQLASGETTFSDEYGEVADKLQQLLEYTDNDVFGSDYSRGNMEFAQGEAAMYMQGIWAIGQVQEANPDIELGVFPLPATNNAEENRLVSGVDLVLATAADADHPEEAQMFVEFLLEEENLQFYIDQQRLFSAVEGPEQTDEAISELQPVFEEGRITSFADHYYPQGFGIDTMFQNFLLEGDKEALLEELDSEYERLAGQ